MTTFDADKARQITKNYLTADDHFIKKILEIIFVRIENKAKVGKNELNYPFDNIQVIDGINHNFTNDEKKAIQVEVVKRGFKWDYKSSQDPGHPSDRPIDTISW